MVVDMENLNVEETANHRLHGLHRFSIDDCRLLFSIINHQSSINNPWPRCLSGALRLTPAPAIRMAAAADRHRDRTAAGDGDHPGGVKFSRATTDYTDFTDNIFLFFL